MKRVKEYKKRVNRFFDDFVSRHGVRVTVNGTQHLVGMISNKRDDTKYTNYVLTDNEVVFSSGSHFEYKDSYWIVLQQEETYGEGYNKFLCVKTNSTVKWVDDKGLVFEKPCYIIGTTNSYVNARFKSFGLANIPEAQLQLRMIMPKASELPQGRKIILEDKPWRVDYVDDLSLPGVMYVSLKERIWNKDDDLELGLGDTGKKDMFRLVPAFSEPLVLAKDEVFDLFFSFYKNNLIVEQKADDVVIRKVNLEDPVVVSGSSVMCEEFGTFLLVAERDGISYSFSIVCADVVSEAMYNILGNKSIKWGATATYNLLEIVDGEYETVPGDFMISDTTKASLVVKDGTGYVTGLRNSMPEVEIVLNAFVDSVLVASKTIKIISILA